MGDPKSQWENWGKNLVKADLIQEMSSMNWKFVLMMGRAFLPLNISDLLSNPDLKNQIVYAKVELKPDLAGSSLSAVPYTERESERMSASNLWKHQEIFLGKPKDFESLKNLFLPYIENSTLSEEQKILTAHSHMGGPAFQFSSDLLLQNNIQLDLIRELTSYWSAIEHEFRDSFTEVHNAKTFPELRMAKDLPS
jgi:hypothetical protein